LEARIIETIGSAGPRNVSKISRMTGVHPETIRYKMKRRFVNRGFRFQAEVDYRKLGLTLYWGRFVVSPAYYRSATMLFRALNHAAYLIHYSKILPEGYFVGLFAIPTGREDEFAGMLENLRKRKAIVGLSLDRVLAQRHKPMETSFFNFRKGRWEVDWTKVRESRGTPLTAEKDRTEMLADYADMLIINELQKDARQHIVEIARKLKINPKTLEYHYRAHVMKNKLIPGFSVRWISDMQEPLERSTVTIRLTFRGLDANRYKAVQGVMCKIPYLWVEDMLDAGSYLATLTVPLKDFGPTLKYLNDELQFLGGEVEMGYLSVADSFNYTIPYHMFEKGKWQFDAKKMESSVLKEFRSRVEK
jgi:DNA-binding Lrp family transcriptional regulator